MNNFIKVFDCKPNDCDDKEIADFMAFVLAGGEVASNGLEGRIRAAERLVFLRLCGCLSGVAALKRPSQQHRKEVSSRSAVPLLEAAYPFELGWLFVMPSARGRSFSVDLSRVAVSAAGTAGVFATSRKDNIAMHTTLGKVGFVVMGSCYRSKRGNYELQLFARNPNHKATATDSIQSVGR